MIPSLLVVGILFSGDGAGKARARALAKRTGRKRLGGFMKDLAQIQMMSWTTMSNVGVRTMTRLSFLCSFEVKTVCLTYGPSRALAHVCSACKSPMSHPRLGSEVLIGNQFANQGCMGWLCLLRLIGSPDCFVLPLSIVAVGKRLQQTVFSRAMVPPLSCHSEIPSIFPEKVQH